MIKPLLTIAANNHCWLTFEAYDTPQWHMAIEWLKQAGFNEVGEPIYGLDEGILPSFIKNEVNIEAGFDNWSGNYLLSICDKGDQIILNLALHVSAEDRRITA